LGAQLPCTVSPYYRHSKSSKLRVETLEAEPPAAHALFCSQTVCPPVKICRPSFAAIQEPAVEDLLPNSRRLKSKKLGRCILEWEWAGCTFLVSNSQSTKRCRSQNFASLSLGILLQRRQGRPELSHLRHQAISTPASPSGTTSQPFLTCSRHVVPSNSTGIGFTCTRPTISFTHAGRGCRP